MEVLIEKLDHFGRGITRINDKICFVEGALPKEVVDINIVKENRKFFLAGLNKVIKESEYRVENKCPYFERCGGCQLRHLNYEFENTYKLEKTNELIKRIGKLDLDVSNINYLDEEFYRNKIVFHVNNKRLGLYNNSSNDLVEIDECLLVSRKINELIPTLKKIVECSNISEVMVRVSNDEKDIMVSINGEVTNLCGLEKLVTSIIVNDKAIFGSSYLKSDIGNKTFLVSNNSFFQVNRMLTEKLYDEVKEFCIKNKVSKVLDLYCGTGTIGIYISDFVESVFGIDVASSSIMDARENAKLNNVSNATYVCSKVEDYIDSVKEKYDLIVVDPPRSGLDNKTIDNLFRLNAKNIIYISCDPATLSRDLMLLNEKYNIESIKAFNMFPRTYHVECICVLSLR